jgi:hypothetical protein
MATPFGPERGERSRPGRAGRRPRARRAGAPFEPLEGRCLLAAPAAPIDLFPIEHLTSPRIAEVDANHDSPQNAQALPPDREVYLTGSLRRGETVDLYKITPPDGTVGERLEVDWGVEADGERHPGPWPGLAATMGHLVVYDRAGHSLVDLALTPGTKTQALPLDGNPPVLYAGILRGSAVDVAGPDVTDVAYQLRVQHQTTTATQDLPAGDSEFSTSVSLGTTTGFQVVSPIPTAPITLPSIDPPSPPADDTTASSLPTTNPAIPTPPSPAPLPDVPSTGPIPGRKPGGPSIDPNAPLPTSPPTPTVGLFADDGPGPIVGPGDAVRVDLERLDSALALPGSVRRREWGDLPLLPWDEADAVSIARRILGVNGPDLPDEERPGLPVTMRRPALLAIDDGGPVAAGPLGAITLPALDREAAVPPPAATEVVEEAIPPPHAPNVEGEGVDDPPAGARPRWSLLVALNGMTVLLIGAVHGDLTGVLRRSRRRGSARRRMKVSRPE